MSAKSKIKRAKALVQESLDSHVIAIIAPQALGKATKKFHGECIKEYREILDILDYLREYIRELEG